MKVARHLHLLGATGQIRSAKFHGRDHLVVPVVALVEGVIFPVNAATPELVLASEFAMAPQGWNGRPVFANHPAANGTQISGNTPETLETLSFGNVFNAHVEGKRLKMEAWLDREKAAKVGRDAMRVIERAEAGEMIEVSVGAYVVAEPRVGEHSGKPFKAVWHDIVPDHLAMLPEGTIGACSIAMGCGSPRTAVAHLVTAEGLEPRDAGGEGSGFFGHAGRPGEVGGSSPWDAAVAEFAKQIPEKDRKAIQQRPDGIVAKRWEAKLRQVLIDKGFHPGVFVPRKFNLVDHLRAAEGHIMDETEDLSAEEAELRAAAGARHSASDVQLIQDMHDKAVSLGAKCGGDSPLADRYAAAFEAQNEFRSLVAQLDPKLLEAKDEHPFTYCMETIIPAIEEKGKPVSDPEAFCGWWKAQRKDAQSAPEHQCSCGGHKAASEGVDMTKKERIKALIDSPYTLFENGDEAMLETASDARLDVFEKDASALKAAAEQQVTERAAAEKAAADQAAAEATKKAELAAAAAKPKTEDEWLKEAPESVRKVVARAAAAEAQRKSELVAKLKTAQAEYTEDELNAVDIDQLERFARMFKVNEVATPDYSGRGGPRAAAADAETIPAPPDMNARIRELSGKERAH